MPNQQPRAKSSRFAKRGIFLSKAGRALARQIVSLKANLQYAASGGELNPLRLKILMHRLSINLLALDIR